MSVPISETVWMTGIVEAEVKEHPQMPEAKLVSLVLQNGRQYMIPLQGDLLKIIQRGVSPVTIARSLPHDGHRA